MPYWRYTAANAPYPPSELRPSAQQPDASSTRPPAPAPPHATGHGHSHSHTAGHAVVPVPGQMYGQAPGAVMQPVSYGLAPTGPRHHRGQTTASNAAAAAAAPFRTIPPLHARSSFQSRPYHAKRPHRKSRTGCHNCKMRKVKCNEAYPRCRACTQRKETCVYPPQHTDPVASRTSTSTGTRPSALYTTSMPAQCELPPAMPQCELSVPQCELPPTTRLPLSPPASTGDSGASISGHSDDADTGRTAPRGVGVIGWQGVAASEHVDDAYGLLHEPMFVPSRFDGTDMRILWFYTAKSFSAFSSQVNRQPKIDAVLKVDIPRHAFTSPFLMDCILALSALEMRSLGQPVELSRVLRYRAHAFTGYRRAVESATPEKYPTLLAASLLLCALSSEMFRDPGCAPLYILDWMVVWRGIGLIVKLIHPADLQASGLAILFARPVIDMVASVQYIPNHLLLLISMVAPDDPDRRYLAAYHETLKVLGSLYREMATNGMGLVMSLRITVWFTFVPRLFVEAARQRRPRALIILGHYLIFTKMCTHMWWMLGIADKEINDIRNVLPAAWLPFYASPLAALEATSFARLQQIVLDQANWASDPFYDAARAALATESMPPEVGNVRRVVTGSWMNEDPGTARQWGENDYIELAKQRFSHDELADMALLNINDEGS